ncbi:MAG: M81 family metallopeptidase [Bacteroidota bacterium]
MRPIILFLTGVLLFGCTLKQGPIRILTAGIAHESNSFNPVLTTEKNFIVNRGNSILENQDWATYLKGEAVEIIPVIHAHANPSGTVSKITYESFKNEILDAIKKAGKMDGIYLDMHGALNVEGYEDAQVDFIKSIRKITGDEFLIAGSFDLHGNISQEFVNGLNILTAYRTAPHVDMAETKLRTVTLLLKAIREDLHPVVAHINVPVLIPGEKGITSVEPLKSLYALLPSIALEEGLMDASIFVGMPWTDVNRAGMSVQVVAKDKSSLDKAMKEAGRIATEIWNHRTELKFDVRVSDIDDAIKEAQASRESTVFITDSGDNTTAGAAGDNPLVLSRLLEHKVKDAIVAGIVDPDAVNACELAGVGSTIDLTIGGKMDTIFGTPLKIHGKVSSVFNTDSSSLYFGKQAIVDVSGIQLILISNMASYTSPDEFKKAGIEPLAHKIVIVKLGYLFQGLRDIAPKTIMALTPGFAYQVIENLPYKNVRRPIFPLDPEMTWATDSNLFQQ